MTNNFSRKVNSRSWDDAPLPRTAPHNLDAEQALLGALLLYNECADKFGGFLRADHFFDPLHQRIYQEAMDMIAGGKLANPITLRTTFADTAPINPNLTVPQYLGTLAGSATTIINVEEYARTIYDLATRRALIIIGEDIVNDAYGVWLDNPVAQQIEAAETRLFEAAQGGAATPAQRSIADSVGRVFTRTERAYNVGGISPGITTGLVDLDRKLGGLQPGGLYVVAGRPSMGKTALALGMAYAAAEKQRDAERRPKPPEDTPEGQLPAEPPKKLNEPRGARALIYSLEMTDEQLATRLLSTKARVPSALIRSGEMEPDQMLAVSQARERIASVPVWIDETGGISIGQLATRARRAKRQHNIGLLVVDYLQLMAGRGDRRNDNRVQEITEITKGLKNLAKELAVPVIALSQLSRNVEHREDKRPQLSDLRESGSIEQDADVVIFVYREEYYLERTKPDRSDITAMADWEAAHALVRGKAELIFGKHREGPTGTVHVAFESEYSTFSNLSRREE